MIKKIILSSLIGLLIHQENYSIHQSELHATHNTLTRLKRHESQLKSQLEKQTLGSESNNISLALEIARINLLKAPLAHDTNSPQDQIAIIEERINQLQKVVTLRKKHTNAEITQILLKEINDLKHEAS